MNIKMNFKELSQEIPLSIDEKMVLGGGITAEVKEKLGYWLPNRKYDVGDYVIAVYQVVYDDVVLHIHDVNRCIKAHTSPNKTFINSSEDYREYWVSCEDDTLDVEMAYRAYTDENGNRIRKTYATKKEVEDNYATKKEVEDNYATKEDLSAVETNGIFYDFDETYTITEEEATATTWLRTVDSEGNPINLSEMQVDFTIPPGTNTGTQYLYFNYAGKNMRVSEFAYQHASEVRHIRVLCYKERESFYAIRGYMWTDNSNYTSMGATSGARMGIGYFFENPKPLRGLYFTVGTATTTGFPAAGTTVRIRGKRINEN